MTKIPCIKNISLVDKKLLYHIKVDKLKTSTEISRTLNISFTTTLKILERLEKNNMIKRKKSGVCRYITITKNGLNYINNRIPKTNIKKLIVNCMFNGILLKKNISEHFLDYILQINFPNEWKFVGNGKVIIGNKNPDFINIKNKKKMIIELFGLYYHKKIHEKQKIEYFKKYGYKTLIIWVNELENIKELIRKISCFMDVK